MIPEMTRGQPPGELGEASQRGGGGGGGGGRRVWGSGIPARTHTHTHTTREIHDISGQSMIKVILGNKYTQLGTRKIS